MKKNEISSLTKHHSKIYDKISSRYSAIITFILIGIWGLVGFFMHFDEVWYKILHLSELLITLLMVFIIQHMEKVETQAIQEKLDEIIKSIPKADNKKMKVEKRLKGELG